MSVARHEVPGGTAKRSKNIAQAFRPGKATPDGKHPEGVPYVGRPIGLFREAVTETGSVALAEQISFPF
jgi:hypothetical protein